jgi:DNA helicase-2/ATP-dependent DNA helicase PcrA
MSLKLVKQESIKFEDKLLDGLNSSQSEAVQIINGPLLIIAGAGSGKTRVLTHRIAYMISQGVNPESILALTFTNKAANEMKQRISSLIPKEAVNRIWAGTFHSIFARILRYEAQAMGYTSSFSIYDADDSLSLVRRVMNTQGYSQLKESPQNIRNKISYHKNQLQSWQDVAEKADFADKKIVAEIFKEYEIELRKNNAMDFDDLLINMINLFMNHPDILLKYQQKFKYILVDEFQDTNRPQYLVCRYLSSLEKNICVVGDDAQSIYKWRGADINNILGFKSDFPNTVTVKLERNYRSTKNILGLADSVISYNKKQIPKSLFTENPDGEKVKVVTCSDEVEEADFIIKKLIDLGKANVSVKDCAVLYRTNAQSLAFENSCRKYNVPYIVIGGMSFYKRKEVKDILSYLKFICNPADSESLLRIVNEPPRGIGTTSLNHLREFAQKNKYTLYEAFSNCEEIPELQTRAKNAFLAFVKFVDNFIEQKKSNEQRSFINDFINATGLIQYYQELQTDDAYDRINNIQQTLSDASLFLADNPDLKIEDYLQQISLIADIDEKDMTLDKLKLMTVHASKGLEFSYVFIAGLEKGLFPFTRNEKTEDDIEEERRLFYVAITRAMNDLFITFAKRRVRFGEFSNQPPSRFLDELDKKYIQKEFASGALIKEQVRIAEKSKAFDNYSQIPEKEVDKPFDISQGYKIGDKVRHSHFGAGQIVALSGFGTSLQAIVNFDNVGRKKLMLAYAKLQRL